MKRILVTGSEGQLGKCIQKIAGNYPSLRFEFRDSPNLDITDTKKVNAVFES